jgi:hypothetical protein
VGLEELDKFRNGKFTNLLLFISLSKIYCLVLDFVLTNDPNIVVGLNLSVSDLLVEVITTLVNAYRVTLKQQSVVDLLCKLIALWVHRDKLQLSW